MSNQKALKTASELVEANIVSGDIDDDTAVVTVAGLIGDIAQILASSQEPAPVASIVPEVCAGSALAFSDGVLHVSKDGSGYIAVDEEHWSLEDDRAEGPDGPEGSVHWITRFPPGEMQALRDFLNGAKFSAAPSSAAIDLLQKAREFIECSAFNVPTKDYFDATLKTIDEALATPAASQEPAPVANEIADAVLGWMVKYDLLDAGNEYSPADVLAALNDLTPSERAAPVPPVVGEDAVE